MNDATVLGLLGEIRDELRGLRIDLAEQRARTASKAPVKLNNPKVLERVIQAISDAMNHTSNCFSTEIANGMGTDPALRKAYEFVYGHAAEIDPRKIGEILKRAAGKTYGGIRIDRSTKNFAPGILWTIERRVVARSHHDVSTDSVTEDHGAGLIE